MQPGDGRPILRDGTGGILLPAKSDEVQIRRAQHRLCIRNSNEYNLVSARLQFARKRRHGIQVSEQR
jgi:hypothetical protein